MSETQYLGRNIRNKREELGWSLEYTAAKCDLSPRELENIELGKTAPNFTTMLKITKALNVD